MQKSTQANLFSLVIVIIFSASLGIFFHVYEEYRMAKSNSLKVDRHYAELLNKKAQLEKIQGYANLANKVNNAIKTLNYTSRQWTTYQVDLDKGLSFSELSYILNQTQHGKDYFFVPGKLEVTLPEKTPSLVTKKVDAHLKLQGHYLVKK